jgi:multidrug efflux system outer membrane protein
MNCNAASRAVALGLLTLAGCSVGPDYRRPTLPMPAAYSESDAADSHLDPSWWRLFGDDALSSLEHRALAGNPGLDAALARVAEARAVSAEAASGRYPTLTFGPTLTHQRNPLTGPGVTTALVMPFDLSYEIDVWGKERRTVEASQAQALASADNYAVVLMSLTANVATTYYTLRSLDNQADVLVRSVESSRKQLELTRTKRDAALVGPPDVLQAQAQLDATLAQQAEVLRQRSDSEHALAILIGEPPSALSLRSAPLAGNPPLVPAGLPSTLLRRPDVVAGEHALVAASASIGVAKANLYPTFSLTASGGLASSSLTGALGWANGLWSLGGGLLAPIFEGGKLRAQVEQAKGGYDEALGNYRTAVLQALADVENGLTDVGHLQESGAAYQRAADAAREDLRLVQLEYDQGLVDYLQVLDAQRTWLGDELLAAQTLGQRYVSTVLLVKALGGGWTVDDGARVLDAARARGPEPQRRAGDFMR